MSTVLSGSRRRAALLASEPGVHLPTTQRLTLADVARLQDNSDADARACVARKLGLSFEELAQGRTGQLAQAVLYLLVEDAEMTVRAALAAAIAPCPALPAAIASKLATDEIEVARPILERSPVLRDDELIEVVQAQAAPYALAVAGRETIASRLCDALVATGASDVVARLVGNQGSRLSQATLKRILEDYPDDEQVHDLLAHRPGLPDAVVARLLDAIGRRLEWTLISTRKMSSEEARRLVAAVRDQTATGIAPREHDRRVFMSVQEEHQDKPLDPIDALAALRDGRIARFEGIMAVRADQDPAVVRRLLYDMDEGGTSALCLRAGCGVSHYLAIRMALDAAHDGTSQNGQATSYPVRALHVMQAQYERMRGQPDLVDKLLHDAERVAA